MKSAILILWRTTSCELNKPKNSINEQMQFEQKKIQIVDKKSSLNLEGSSNNRFCVTSSISIFLQSHTQSGRYSKRFLSQHKQQRKKDTNTQTLRSWRLALIWNNKTINLWLMSNVEQKIFILRFYFIVTFFILTAVSAKSVRIPQISIYVYM